MSWKHYAYMTLEEKSIQMKEWEMDEWNERDVKKDTMRNGET